MSVPVRTREGNSQSFDKVICVQRGLKFWSSCVLLPGVKAYMLFRWKWGWKSALRHGSCEFNTAKKQAVEAALGVVCVNLWVPLSENQNIIKEFADKDLKNLKNLKNSYRWWLNVFEIFWGIYNVIKHISYFEGIWCPSFTNKEFKPKKKKDLKKSQRPKVMLNFEFNPLEKILKWTRLIPLPHCKVYPHIKSGTGLGITLTWKNLGMRFLLLNMSQLQ